MSKFIASTSPCVWGRLQSLCSPSCQNRRLSAQTTGSGLLGSNLRLCPPSPERPLAKLPAPPGRRHPRPREEEPQPLSDLRMDVIVTVKSTAGKVWKPATDRTTETTLGREALPVPPTQPGRQGASPGVTRAGDKGVGAVLALVPGQRRAGFNGFGVLGGARWVRELGAGPGDCPLWRALHLCRPHSGQRLRLPGWMEKEQFPLTLANQQGHDLHVKKGKNKTKRGLGGPEVTLGSQAEGAASARVPVSPQPSAPHTCPGAALQVPWTPAQPCPPGPFRG